MKKLIGFFLILLSISSCQEDEKPLQTSGLTEADQTTLLYMREEEKLAHDIYINAFDKYGVLAFQNIATSETKHIEAVLNAMNRYQVTDPLNGSTDVGEFTIPEIQDLYLQLLEKVNESQNEALLVGLLIEDLDIYDLENAIAETNNTTLSFLYENLKCGSMNHMRSFESLASLSSLIYTPIYISQSEYESIISSPRTSCNNQ
ncbi:DUF2202 domain-containing protein [Algoriphagus sp. SE2]|uniref:DUF2202 domain-containing protein n=1 Tax=Algoriphagus sp. SE2 TaxID=3141536 RepID=UPI0031CD8B1D